MDLQTLSTPGLHLLHDTIKAALAEDDSSPNGAKKYAIREHPDWRKQADAIEAELTNRLGYFVPIVW